MKTTTEINEDIFREYDIRGIYNKDLTDDSVYTIGLAIGSIMKKMEKNTIIVGRDNRLSSPYLFDALTKGLIDAGINITNLGLVTTPMYYYALYKLKKDSGVMITGSHNPKEYNGFKISFNGLYNALGKEIKNIYDVIEKKDFVYELGQIDNYDIKEEYISYITSSINIGSNPIRIGIDPGNGTSSIIIKDVLDKLNLNYISINDISDPNFPNHHPDPSKNENLKQLQDLVIDNKLDLGIAYDGDADRAGFVDEKGNIMETDQFMIIVLRNTLNSFNDKRVLYDVKCSRALEDEIVKLGGTPIQYRTGNSYMREKVIKDNIPLGVEFSGHIWFNDKFYGADDGIYASLRMIEILSNTDKRVTELLEGISKYYSTDEIKFDTTDENKFIIVDKMKEYAKDKGYQFIDIDGVKVLFEDGFVLVRASNTTPTITTRFEAKTEDRLNEIQKEFTNVLNRLIEEIR